MGIGVNTEPPAAPTRKMDFLRKDLCSWTLIKTLMVRFILFVWVYQCRSSRKILARPLRYQSPVFASFWTPEALKSWNRACGRWHPMACREIHRSKLAPAQMARFLFLTMNILCSKFTSIISIPCQYFICQPSIRRFCLLDLSSS
jgi:hypothetical protein